MHVNGLGTANCQATGYMAGKTAKRAQQSRFLEAASEQILHKERDYDEEAFESVGANAPEEVKQAWMEAAKEIGANGLGIGKNGMMTHISQMMVERVERGTAAIRMIFWEAVCSPRSVPQRRRFMIWIIRLRQDMHEASRCRTAACRKGNSIWRLLIVWSGYNFF